MFRFTGPGFTSLLQDNLFFSNENLRTNCIFPISDHKKTVHLLIHTPTHRLIKSVTYFIFYYVLYVLSFCSCLMLVAKLHQTKQSVCSSLMVTLEAGMSAQYDAPTTQNAPSQYKYYYLVILLQWLIFVQCN